MPLRSGNMNLGKEELPRQCYIIIKLCFVASRLQAERFKVYRTFLHLLHKSLFGVIISTKFMEQHSYCGRERESSYEVAAMKEKYIIVDMVSGEYLAEKFLRGFYLTSDISQAIQAKSEADARAKIDKQTVKSSDAFKVETITVS